MKTFDTELELPETKILSMVMADGEEINLEDVEFLNISEDFFGVDLVDFAYKGKTYQSYVRQKRV